ncbi:MAG TPA: hypothetical protein VHF05_01730 [Candidatus Paceibacterota bacterium]|jgi:hypothetical protein|nr:hypothetical protein [Candidatus Paceibacterota bacterium]
MDISSDDFIARLNTIPPEIDAATSSFGFLAALYEIAGKYHLDDEQAGIMIDLSNLRAIELLKREELAAQIDKIQGIDSETAKKVSNEIETNVMNQLLHFAHGDISTDEFYRIYDAYKKAQPKAEGLAFLDNRLGGEKTDESKLMPMVEKQPAPTQSETPRPTQPQVSIPTAGPNIKVEEIKKPEPATPTFTPPPPQTPAPQPSTAPAAPNSAPQPQPAQPSTPKQYPGGQDPYREPLE